MRGPDKRCRRCGKMFYSLSCFLPEYGDVCINCFHDVYVTAKATPGPVISPPHYTAGGIETIDFIKAKLTHDEFRGYLKGSIIKYLSRANLKGSEDEDYRKASFYSRMLAGEDPRGGGE
jgi:hypothetical protein